MVVLGLVALPVLALATIAGRRYPPPISEITMRRIAFVMLAAIGALLMVSVAPQLGLMTP
jgi:hypothetical protein